jgi:hypothetical protein
MSSTPCERETIWCSSMRPIFEVASVCSTPFTEKLKGNKFVLALMLGSSFYFGYQEYWMKKGCWTCGEPHYQCDYLVERTRASGSVGPTTMGDLGKAHWIHAMVNNYEEEHQSTMLETSGIVIDQTLSILIDPGATNSFISGAVLKRIKVKAVEQDEFSFVEMASGAKQKVGGKVMGCSLNLGEFVTRANLYVTILGSYDIVIGMDWLESHEAILNCKTKRLSFVDEEGHRCMIVGQNQGVSLRFISSL